jgi:hypothetical protein
MVKDLVVNLTGGHPQDFAADFALSMAASYAAHALGVGFIYEPVIPGDMLGGIPTDLIDVQREENRKAAEVAASRFEAAAKAGSISAETRILDASLAGAPDLFGRIARRYDIAVVGQAAGSKGLPRNCSSKVRCLVPGDRSSSSLIPTRKASSLTVS